MTDYISVAGDVNGDGSINTEDIDLIKEYILEKIDFFPVENQ